MAFHSLKSRVVGHCVVDIVLKEHLYPSCRLGILKYLCRDIILDQDFQKEHKNVIIECRGSKPDLMIPKFTPVCALSAAQLEEPSLFENLRPDCKLIASKSRRFSKEDQDFIQQEINKLLSEDIWEL